MNGEPARRRPISLAELAGVPPRRRATLAVDTNQRLREVTARAQLPAVLLSVPVQAHVVTVLREPQAKTPEGRSAVLQDIRDLLEGRRLCGIKEARSQVAEKPPRRKAEADITDWDGPTCWHYARGAWDLELKSELRSEGGIAWKR